MKNLPAGTYTVAARATDKSGVSSDSAEISFVVRPKRPLQINVSSPVVGGGLTIQDDHVRILGTVQAPPNSAVSVNGLVGNVLPDKTFFINAVPLVVGSNTLTVTLTDPDGNTASQTITVTSTGPGPFRFLASPDEALIPLQVSIDLSAAFGMTFTHVDVLCADNAAPLVITSVTESSFATCTYPSPETIGTMRVNVYAQQGSAEQLIYTDASSFYGQAPQVRSHLLRGVYINMLARLKLADTAGALRTMSWNASQKLGPIFGAIGAATMPAIVPGFGSLATMNLQEPSGEAMIVRTTPTGNVGYRVEFLRCEDGVWRIDDM